MKYCNYFVETPKYERCMNFAEPGKYRCSEHRAPQKKGRSAPLTDAIKGHVREAYNNSCAICGAPANEVDHIVEYSLFSEQEKWKANSLSNLQLLCPEHHLEKTNSFRKEQIEEVNPFDRSTSARNRKKKRLRKAGYYYK